MNLFWQERAQELLLTSYSLRRTHHSIDYILAFSAVATAFVALVRRFAHLCVRKKHASIVRLACWLHLALLVAFPLFINRAYRSLDPPYFVYDNNTVVGSISTRGLSLYVSQIRHAIWIGIGAGEVIVVWFMSLNINWEEDEAEAATPLAVPLISVTPSDIEEGLVPLAKPVVHQDVKVDESLLRAPDSEWV